jgi:hypothetical protein
LAVFGHFLHHAAATAPSHVALNGGQIGRRASEKSPPRNLGVSTAK